MTTCIGRSDVHRPLGITAPRVWIGVERYGEAFPRHDLGRSARIDALGLSLPAGLSLLGNYQRGIGLSSLLEQARDLAESHRAHRGSNAFPDRSARPVRPVSTPESRRV